jgi:hypothetical protein
MLADHNLSRPAEAFLDRGLLQLVADGTMLRSVPNPSPQPGWPHIRDARPAGPPPGPAAEPLKVRRRVSCRGAIVVAGASRTIRWPQRERRLVGWLASLRMRDDLHHVAHGLPRPAEVPGLHGAARRAMIAEAFGPDLIEARPVAL